jgi:hypothetical protein
MARYSADFPNKRMCDAHWELTSAIKILSNIPYEKGVSSVSERRSIDEAIRTVDKAMKLLVIPSKRKLKEVV